MSAANSNNNYRLSEGSRWAGLWKVAAGLGVVGLGITAWAFLADPVHFGYSYLYGFFAILTFLFGALFLVIAEHLTAGHWGVTTRRLAEFILAGAPVLAVFGAIYLVLALTGKVHVYDEWMGGHHDDEAAHAVVEQGLFGASVAHASSGESHGAHGDLYPRGHSAQEAELHHHVLEHKAPYLNKSRFFIFGLVYLLIWVGLSFFYYRRSVKQDEDHDPSHTVKLRAFAPVAAILFGLSLTFAAFDWLMSLEPAWYSTIFGVVIFGGSAAAIFALLIVWGVSLHRSGEVGDAINVEHIHDLGKMMFGFFCFWTYVSFSQWMLIWYAGIPEEAVFFHKRWQGGWQTVSVMMILLHFALPFLLFISRIFKRNLVWARIMASVILFIHLVDVYWYVLPNGSPVVGHGMLFDVGALLMVGGFFFALVFKKMNDHALIPVGDPLLERSLHHHQSY
ncbi:MAG: hypothetical protein GXY23_13235 [Myxococcales bacterium]|nr:hypothetical protein [Myxococcales bacterium]